MKHYQNGNQTAKENGSRFNIRIQATEEVQPSSDHHLLLVPVRGSGRSCDSGCLLHEPHQTRKLELGEEGGVGWQVEGEQQAC